MSAPYSNQFNPYVGNTPSLGNAMFRYHLDVPLFALALFIIVVSLFVMYGATGQNVRETFITHGSHLGAAILVMWISALIHPNTWKRWTPVFFILFLVPLVLVWAMDNQFVFTVKGAKRWLGYGGFRFQPSDMYKILLPMMVAWLVADARLPIRFVHFIVGVIIIAIPCALVVLQPDLGTAVFIAMSGLIALFLAGMRWLIIIVLLVIAILGGAIAWNTGLIKPYQKQRVLNVFSDKRDKQGTHWQTEQSNIAIGSGGVYGKGYLAGTQSRFGFLPEAKTDFVYAVVAEEFGLFGALFVLMLYLLILFRGLVIATSAKDTYSRILAGTICIALMVNASINIMMVIGILPVVGLPLPPFSRGGTAILIWAWSIGMLMSIQTHRRMM